VVFGAGVLTEPPAPGLGLAFGLKRLPIAESGFEGEADATGEGEAVAAAFFLLRRCLGDAEGEAAADAALLAAGDGEAAAFLWLRFAGDAEEAGEGLGDGD